MCDQYKCVTPLCHSHAARSACWSATAVRWMDYPGKAEGLTNMDFDTFLNKIWKKLFCAEKRSQIKNVLRCK